MNQYANDFNRTVLTYYEELSKYKPLSRSSEKRLIKLAKRGNDDAKRKVIESNLKFVFDVAKRYTGRGVPISDLISEGNIGLVKAIEKFDETKDVKFISYAVWWIRHSIITAIKRQKFLSSTEIEPCEANDDVMSNKMGYTDDDDEVYDDRFDAVDNDENLDKLKEKQRAAISDIVGSLSPRERDVIEMYYGIGDEGCKTLQDIGEKYGLSIERVRQIKLGAIRKLRSMIMLRDDMEELR